MDGNAPLWLRVVLQLGVPAAIALYLTYALLGEVRADIKSMRAEHGLLIYYSRGICLNTAGDNMAAQQRCILDGKSDSAK